MATITDTLRTTFDVLGIDEYRRAFDQAAEANRKLEREEKKREKDAPVGNRPRTFAQLAFQIGGAFAAFDLVAGGLERAGSAIANLIVPAVEAFGRQQDALVQMEILFRNLGRAAEIEGITDFNRNLQAMSGQTTAALASLTAMLLRFKFTREELQRTTPVLLDFAAATGIELPRAADLLGSVLRGEQDAIQAFGVNVDLTKSRAEILNTALTQLEERYRGGVAVAIRTQSGALRDLAYSFDELKAAAGRGLEPFVVNLSNAAAEVNRSITDFIKLHTDLLLPSPAAAAQGLGAGSPSGPATEATAQKIAQNTKMQGQAIDALLKSGGGPLARGAINIRGLNAALKAVR